MADELPHRGGRVTATRVQGSIAVGWIGHQATTSVRKRGLLEDIDPGPTKTAIVKVAGHDLMAVSFQDASHCPIAATRLPDRAAKFDALHQSLRDPGRRRVKIVLNTI